MRKSIVVVEDSDADFEALCRAFQKSCLTLPITRLKDGEEAWTWLSRFLAEPSQASTNQPALILLDLNLPGRDGFEILEQRKRSPALCRVPVVVFTTSDEAHDVERCYELGANSIIQKPIDTDRLMDVIKSVQEYWLTTVMLPS